MKRLLGSSQTLTHQLARSNSKTRRPYSRDHISTEKKPSKLPNSVISNAKRHVSISTLDSRDDGMTVDLDVSRHNMPEKLNWYWNLDEDHKRKITDPTYVRQAVQDTFMQRAQGGYQYKRSGPVRSNSSSAKSTQPGSQRKSEVSIKSAKAKPAKPPPPSPEKLIMRPQVPKRKRMIDTAKPMQQYFKPKVQPEQRKAKLGAHLKEAGQKQLEEAKKKLYDPAPAVLDYLIDKHVPKVAGLQRHNAFARSVIPESTRFSDRGRKEKPAAETPQLPRVPSLMQRVFGWKGREEPKKNDSDISITPRSIEVSKKSSRRLLDLKPTKKTGNIDAADGRSQKTRKPGKLRISFKGSARSARKETPIVEKKAKKPAEGLEEQSARQIQAEEDREAIWKKMKTPTATTTSRTTEEVASVKKQVRDFELTPQIYPKGSLSLRKSYLPITACRPRMDVGRPTESHTSVYTLKQGEKQPLSVKQPPSITDHILDSLKNIFSKMRRNSA